MSKTATAIKDDVIETATDNVRPLPANQMLEPTRLKQPGQAWREWQADVPAGISLERIMDGRFWARAGRGVFVRGDIVNWRSDDLRRFGRIVVVAIDQSTMQVEVRALQTEIQVEPASLEEKEFGGFEVRDLGVHDGFAIIRSADGHQMEKNIVSRQEAFDRIKTKHVRNAIAASLRG